MMVNRTALLALLCVFLSNIMHYAKSAKDGDMYSDLLAENRNHRVRRGSISACGGTFTNSSGTFTSPNYPDDYPSDVNCTYYIHGNGLPDSHIQLTFIEFSLSNTDEVMVYDGNDTFESTVIGPFGNVSQYQLPIIRSTGSSLTVQFQSTRSMLFSSGLGFYAEYKTVLSTSDCGGIFTTITGIIASPYYPHSYPSNMTCYYFIIAPDGARIMLQFHKFTLDYSAIVNIYDGFTANDNHLIRSTSGIYIDDVITSDHYAMLLHFESGYHSSGSGFFAKYSRDTCGGTYSTGINGGYIMSPFYPNYYHLFVDIEDCNYIISVSDGNTLQVEFIDFGLEPCCAYLSIYDGSSNESPLIGQYTGYTLPSKIASTGTNLFLYYYGASYSLSRGFYLAYHNGTVDAYGPFSVCGDNIAYGLNGFISSHSSYPSNYPSNRNCSITILMAGVYNYVAFRILDLDMANTAYSNCSESETVDAIRVYDMYGLVASVCSNDGYPHYSTFGNMTVTFTTYEHTGHHSGFKAYFTVYKSRQETWDDCGGWRDFRCNYSDRCLSLKLRCNGYDDCDDESDETECHNPGRDTAIIVGCAVAITIVIIVLIASIMCMCGKQARNAISTQSRGWSVQ
ncbi:CUB domain-containing protein 2-like isoform X2 [Ptychodera flava]|uniref:CUB domain-containing protein 2-like isoform X2 n=1 Tax=Ptychodera flava TaxID=63121 RepID=UPI003969FBC1